MTDIVLYSIIVLLLIIIAILMIRLIRQAKQLKSFTEQLSEIRTENQNRLVNVDSFGKGYVGLAKELQQYVEDEKRLIEKAEEDRQSVNMMVAGISHDFRTPLTAATGYLQMAQQNIEKQMELEKAQLQNVSQLQDSLKLSDQNAEYIDTAQTKIKYLRELSDEFFTLSLIESSGGEELKKLSLKKLLEEVTLSQYDWIKKRELDFSADITEDPCDIRASEVDILRLFENLYSNARKYAKSKLHVELKKSASEIVLSISNDTDIIKIEDIDNIFKPFHRATSGEAEGSGLGLYIAKRIVEKYGGIINASIENGIFTIKTCKSLVK